MIGLCTLLCFQNEIQKLIDILVHNTNDTIRGMYTITNTRLRAPRFDRFVWTVCSLNLTLLRA